LCCCRSGRSSVSPERELDRVELAFKRMDRNNDGYITWEEFTKVNMLH
jgi:Ca2+-binding EF-hand superfamily protein